MIRTAHLLLLMICTVGCKPDSLTSPAAVAPTPLAPSASVTKIRFADVTDKTGIQFAYKNSGQSKMYTILESLGGGGASFDFDSDGLLDLAFAGGGQIHPDSTSGLPSGLFRNLGDWQFQDVSQSAGDGFPSARYTHGIASADYDNDGFCDFLVTGFGGLQLWHNQGDGTFVESREAAKLVDDSWSSSAAWGDFNNDGSLDLYVEHYVNWSFQNHPYCSAAFPNQRDICPPRKFEGLPDTLFISNQDGTFRDSSREAKLRLDGKGLGVLAADFDGDSDLDVYIANDTTDNFLYLNDGNAVFEEVGMIYGVAVDDRGSPNGSMGVDLCDFNNDGRPDIWVANFERETFAMYRNEGRGQFLHVSQMIGVASLGGLFVGFGTSCADFDHDGDDDIAVANGHVILFPQSIPRRQLALVLENEDQRFKRLNFPPGGYFSVDHEGRGLIAADFDNDGRIDLAFSHIDDQVSVVQNEAEPAHWLGVRLIGVSNNRNAIGAAITVVTDQGKSTKHIRGGGSYLSTSDQRLVWGWSQKPEILQVVVKWPNGTATEMKPNGLQQYLTITEPSEKSPNQ